jgi:Alginate lyase/Immunoglobulin domain/Glycine-rich domain
MSKIALCLVLSTIFPATVLPAWALDSGLPPGSNFDLSHWYLQLPTSGGVLTGTAGSVDSVSSAQLVAGFTNAYFYTGPDGAMTFWVPDDGAMTSGSTHPRSELREELVPGDTGVNWTLYGTHILTATCVVLNVPSDTGKVCIGQIHEPNNKPDGSTSAGNEQMIMFDLADQKIYANINLDGNTNWSFSTTFISGSSVALGNPINYTMSVVDGLLQIVVNNVTNSWDLFSGTNYEGHVATNWDAASGNTVYFKAGDYNQTDNTCGCSNNGALVAFYSLTHYHAPSITNQPTSVTVNAGTNVTYTVGASGNGMLSYQWWLNATNLLTGATNVSLTITNVSDTNAGNYFVVVSDNSPFFNSVTSVVASLTLIGPETKYTFTTPGTTTWTCPVGVTSIQVECWGGGGAGGSAIRTPNSNSVQYGGGGAGGAYARENFYTVIPGNTYYVTVGAGGLAATGTLTNGVTVPGGDSWFNSVNSEPVGAGNCVAKGGDGGECAVGNTSATAFGAGGVGTANGSLGDVLFPGGGGGTQTSTVNGYGGGGGGGGGTGAAGNSGDSVNGMGAAAVTGGGPGGNANATQGSSGPGQTPVSGPGGGGGGCRAATQQTGGNGAAGQVVLTCVNNTVVTPTFTGLSMATDRGAFTIIGTGAANQVYVLLTTSSLTPPVTWTPVVTNNADSNGTFSFTDLQVSNFTQRFYRVETP